jgi:hypothetical protein
MPIAAVAVAASCHLYHPIPVAGAPAEQRDTLLERELSPRDLTGSVTAWDEAYGADSIFRPRITGYTTEGIGIRLLRAAHVAVLVNSRCGPYAAVPGRTLTTRQPAGDQWLVTVAPFRSNCAPTFWRPMLTVVVSELPLHGEVLEERARAAHGVEEIMTGRRDRWAAYAVFTNRLP